jgi:hypothetical protein
LDTALLTSAIVVRSIVFKTTTYYTKLRCTPTCPLSLAAATGTSKGSHHRQRSRELHGTVAHAGAIAVTTAFVTQVEIVSGSAHVKAGGSKTVVCMCANSATSDFSVRVSSSILQVLNI